MSDTIFVRLVTALDNALEYDKNVVAAPIALLWPDETRQFEAVISQLQQHRRVLQYGAYEPVKNQGPAYWLRCVIAGTVESDGLPEGVPVVYLPGVSREALRALESVAADLAPLGALQYRCQWFSHPNGKDWTVRGFLANPDQGLGLNVANDTATGEALVSSLHLLLQQPIARLKSKQIDASFLNGLLNPDPIRSLLNWLDDPTAMRSGLVDGAWAAFVEQCKQNLGFDPASEGEIEGARRLGEAKGMWAQAWKRYRENPSDYPNLPGRLRQARPPEFLPANPGAWPSISEDAEELIRGALNGLVHCSPQEAREQILKLEDEHKVRRSYVWADLGMTPLVLALEHIAEAARITSWSFPSDSVEIIVNWYATTGWRADRAVIAALNEADRNVDVNAVEAAITAIYRPWLDAAARSLQLVLGLMLNAGTYTTAEAPKPTSGEVVVFVDGLRLDVAHLLAERLNGAGLDTHISTGLAALPTVTQTSKPALVPIDQNLLSAGDALDARRAPDGPAAGVQVLRALMVDSGVQVLSSSEVGDPSGVAWTETGELDRRGHALGVRLAHEVDDEVQRIATRIGDLLDAGWVKATIVTDHGWLLLPGGLPKNDDLPIAVTEVKKGRCARVKDGAVLSVPTVPWHWDSGVRIAIAPGISCFEANQTYEHGGVSPQECVVPRLSVSRGASATTGATITSMKWRGLTLVVEFTDLPDGATIDLRSSAGDASSSIADRARLTGGRGRELMLVRDDDLEGLRVHFVVIGADGSVILQRETTVGQNR